MLARPGSLYGNFVKETSQLLYLPELFKWVQQPSSYDNSSWGVLGLVGGGLHFFEDSWSHCVPQQRKSHGRVQPPTGSAPTTRSPEYPGHSLHRAVTAPLSCSLQADCQGDREVKCGGFKTCGPAKALEVATERTRGVERERERCGGGLHCPDKRGKFGRGEGGRVELGGHGWGPGVRCMSQTQ